MYDYIQQKGEASLADLRRKFAEDRRAIHYNLPILYDNGEIRCFIRGNGLKDDHIIYTVVDGKTLPQYVKNLIEQMCGRDDKLAEQTRNEFIELCINQGVHIHNARILAHGIMAGVPGLKEKVPYELTYKAVLGSEFNNQDKERKKDKSKIPENIKRENIKLFINLKILDLMKTAWKTAGLELFIESDPDFPPVSVKDLDDGKED